MVPAEPCFFDPDGVQKRRTEKEHWKGIGCMRHLELHRACEASKPNCILSVLLALCAAASAVRAQTTLGSPPQSSKGTIRGVVTVLGQQAEPSLLEGVSVELRESSQDSQPLATLTDSAGHYEFTPLPAGKYTLRVSQQGWHELKIGADVTHRSFAGNNLSHPVQLLRQDGTLAEEISFASDGRLSASATDVEEFIQDQWTLNEHLAISLGGRLTNETVGRAAAFAPRVGVAYSPGKKQKTIFRAGAGLFYDRVSLLEASFARNPARTVSVFDETGKPIGMPILYHNAYVGNGAGPLSSRVRSAPNSSPRSFVGNIEVDRQLWSTATLRVSWLYSQTRNLFIVNPVPGVFGGDGLLGLFNTGAANYHEFEATLHFRPVRHADLNISYVWSRARGDLNTVSNIFLPFEQPVIRPNVSGILPSDVPNRVVSWGVFELPWSLIVSPVVDVHTGFPYSNVDVLQNYAGLPNGRRFPTFFSLDAQVYRDFHLHLPFTEHGSRRKVRVGLYSINLTNHGNFHDVYNNVTSPFFGKFNGFQRRVDGFLLSFGN